MSTFAIYAVGAALLVVIGLHGALTQDHLVRKILAMNVVSGGVFLFLIAVGFRPGAGAADPVPQALVLTGIVVAVSVSGFGLAIARRLHARTGRTRLREEDLE
ncbi:MAG TPA: cation:proton antiporter subunit C [Candidatus Limnocylindrales bacterium]|nr:cation:proton antiporter subunit C [Candidatus Limnocylindrales bacterium]